MANEIFKIKENGERELCASYDQSFSAIYTMQLWWCYMHKCSFYDKRNLNKAKDAIKVSVSGHTAFFEKDGIVYACTTTDRLASEGIGESALEF